MTDTVRKQIGHVDVDNVRRVSESTVKQGAKVLFKGENVVYLSAKLHLAGHHSPVAMIQWNTVNRYYLM